MGLRPRLMDKSPKEVVWLISAASVCRCGTETVEVALLQTLAQHLCFCCGEACQAFFAQRLVPPAPSRLETGFTLGSGLRSAKVLEPEAEVRRGLSLIGIPR